MINPETNLDASASRQLPDESGQRTSADSIIVNWEGSAKVLTIYANVVHLAIGRSDLALDFGFVPPTDPASGTGEWEPTVRVIMSATQLQSLLAHLHDQLSGEPSDTVQPRAARYQTSTPITKRARTLDSSVRRRRDPPPGSSPPPDTSATLNSEDDLTPEPAVGSVEEAPDQDHTEARPFYAQRVTIDDPAGPVPYWSESEPDEMWIRQPTDARWNYREEQLWSWENEGSNRDERLADKYQQDS